MGAKGFAPLSQLLTATTTPGSLFGTRGVKLSLNDITEEDNGVDIAIEDDNIEDDNDVVVDDDDDDDKGVEDM